MNRLSSNISLALFVLGLLGLVLTSPSPAVAAEPGGGFCEECIAAGNCCNPNRVLCVTCLAGSGPQDGLDVTFQSKLEAASDFFEEENFGAQDGGFCEECIAAGNCCNPNRVLCVSCAASGAAAQPGSAANDS